MNLQPRALACGVARCRQHTGLHHPIKEGGYEPRQKHAKMWRAITKRRQLAGALGGRVPYELFSLNSKLHLKGEVLRLIFDNGDYKGDMRYHSLHRPRLNNRL